LVVAIRWLDVLLLENHASPPRPVLCIHPIVRSDCKRALAVVRVESHVTTQMCYSLDRIARAAHSHTINNFHLEPCSSVHQSGKRLLQPTAAPEITNLYPLQHPKQLERGISKVHACNRSWKWGVWFYQPYQPYQPYPALPSFTSLSEGPTALQQPRLTRIKRYCTLFAYLMMFTEKVTIAYDLRTLRAPDSSCSPSPVVTRRTCF
jgi:hypothetical protein